MKPTLKCYAAAIGAPDGVGVAPLSSYSAFYAQWGRAQPLVLVPGLAGGTGLVSRLSARLGERFNTIAYQLRGEEDCFSVRSRFGLDDLVDDLGEFLDYLGLERPIVLGVSFGGALAMQFAAKHPERLGGLVVQGADVRFQRTLLRRIAGRVLSEFPLPADSAFVNQFFNLLIGDRPTDHNLVDFVSSQCWNTDQSVIAHRFRLAEKLDLEGRLDSVRVPTLVLTGERDVLVSAAGLAELRRTLPDAEFVTLPGAGHLAFVTHPDVLVGHVVRFAEQHGWLRDC